MHVNQLKESKFLTKEECGKGILVTITELSQENVAKQGAEEELKYCLHFEETEKPLVVNRINAQLIAQITNEEDTDNWAGHKVVLYNDPTIQFGGKLVGGIRVRAPKIQPKAAAGTAPAKPATVTKKPSLKVSPQPTPDDEAAAASSGVEDDSVPF